MGWVFIVCEREYDEVTQKCEKTFTKTYIVGHFTRGVEEGGVGAVLFVHFENGTVEISFRSMEWRRVVVELRSVHFPTNGTHPLVKSPWYVIYCVYFAVHVTSHVTKDTNEHER